MLATLRTNGRRSGVIARRGETRDDRGMRNLIMSVAVTLAACEPKSDPAADQADYKANDIADTIKLVRDKICACQDQTCTSALLPVLKNIDHSGANLTPEIRRTILGYLHEAQACVLRIGIK